MNSLLSFFKKTQSIELTIRASLVAGFAWGVLAVVLGFLAQLILLTAPGSLPPAMDFGYMRPLFTQTLIFGSLLSFFFAIAYYIVRETSGAELFLAPAACAGFAFHQLGVLLSLVTILAGYNKGREYGEGTWLTDQLIGLALLAFLLVSIQALRSAKKFDWPSRLAVFTGAGALAFYVIGNFGLPYGPLESAALTTGLQDSALQEVYRTGVLVYFIVLPTLTALAYFVPKYYHLPLHSEAMLSFSILGIAVLVPFAGAVNQVYTAAPELLQTIGIFSMISLGAAILSGAFAVQYTLTRGPERVQSDGIGLALRWGLFLLIVLAVLRMILAPRFMQALIGYTPLDPRDLSVDALTYGLLALGASGLLIAQRLKNANYSDRAAKWFALCGGFGALVLIISNLAHGFVQGYEQKAADAEGALVVKEWTEVIMAGSFFKKEASFVVDYLLSFRGLHLVGVLLAALGFTIAALTYFIFLAKRAAGPYQEPKLNTGEPRYPAAASAASHGAH